MSDLTPELRAALVRGLDQIQRYACTPDLVWHEGVRYRLEDGRYVPDAEPVQPGDRPG